MCIVCVAVVPWGSDWASAASAFRAASGSASNQRDSESVIVKNTQRQTEADKALHANLNFGSI